MFRNPDKNPGGKLVVEGKTIVAAEVNAAVRCGPAQRRFVAWAVDMDVTIKSVVMAAAIPARHQSLPAKICDS